MDHPSRRNKLTASIILHVTNFFPSSELQLSNGRLEISAALSQLIYLFRSPVSDWGLVQHGAPRLVQLLVAGSVSTASSFLLGPGPGMEALAASSEREPRIDRFVQLHI